MAENKHSSSHRSTSAAGVRGPRRRHGVARRRGRATALLVVLVALSWSTRAFAQLDPLLFIKRVPPTVIIVMDTSMSMLQDGAGFYYDPTTYTVSNDLAVATALGLDPLTASTYRRKYENFDWDGVADDNRKYVASRIVAVPNTNAAYSTFWDVTRLQIAKQGVSTAVSENDRSVRWGLIKLRQDTPAWRTTATGCDKPVVVSDPGLSGASDGNPCSSGGPGKFGIFAPRVNTPNYDQTTLFGGGSRVVTPGAGTAAAIMTKVAWPLLHASGLIPAGRGGQGYADRPLTFALADAKQAAIDAMAADTAANRTCRNTIVVLITAGKNSGSGAYVSSNSVTTKALEFTTVSGGGVTRRVPIHVIGVKVADSEKAELQTVAGNSGGLYNDVTSASEITAAINYAVQSGFARSADFQTSTKSEFVPVSPIVGTVNLKGARGASGAALPNTDISANPGGQPLPQRSNVLLTAGFSLPGFDGVLRAFPVSYTHLTLPTICSV